MYNGVYLKFLERVMLSALLIKKAQSFIPSSAFIFSVKLFPLLVDQL